MKPQSAKQKGKLFEDYIADQIIAKGLDDRAKRDGASGAGNKEKADVSTNLMILGRNAGIEAKNHKSLHIPEWWKQTLKLEQVGREPILVFKLARTSFSDSLAIIKLDTLLELIKYQKDLEEIENIIAGSNYEKGQLLYKCRDFKTTLNKLINYLKN